LTVRRRPCWSLLRADVTNAQGTESSTTTVVSLPTTEVISIDANGLGGTPVRGLVLPRMRALEHRDHPGERRTQTLSRT
jgi:hypothetical protein